MKSNNVRVDAEGNLIEAPKGDYFYVRQRRVYLPISSGGVMPGLGNAKGVSAMSSADTLETYRSWSGNHRAQRQTQWTLLNGEAFSKYDRQPLRTFETSPKVLNELSAESGEKAILYEITTTTEAVEHHGRGEGVRRTFNSTAITYRVVRVAYGQAFDTATGRWVNEG